MKSSVCTHQAANESLLSGDPVQALRIVGPMLENNPSDLTAWKLGALALIARGDLGSGTKNLRSVALAMAEERNPIQAIATVKEIQDLGQDPKDLIFFSPARHGHEEMAENIRTSYKLQSKQADPDSGPRRSTLRLDKD